MKKIPRRREMQLTVVEYLASAPTEAARMVMFVMAGMPACRRNTWADMGLTGIKGRSR